MLFLVNMEVRETSNSSLIFIVVMSEIFWNNSFKDLIQPVHLYGRQPYKAILQY